MWAMSMEKQLDSAFSLFKRQVDTSYNVYGRGTSRVSGLVTCRLEMRGDQLSRERGLNKR